MTGGISWLTPEWPVPAHVRVLSTLRGGGASSGAYASLNLATHVGDDPARVDGNRRRLHDAARLPQEPLWLEQVHGTQVVINDGPARAPRADAAVALGPGHVCAVLTADCLPVVLVDRAGTRIGVAHAGWRGLAAGVLEATVAALGRNPRDLLAWLGPAIGPAAFEVGAEVREAFLLRTAGSPSCFEANDRGRYQADLHGLARQILANAGVADVHGGGWCTATDRAQFFSYRRDGATGRMATLAWLEPGP